MKLRETAERLFEVLPGRMQTRLRELRADAYVSSHDMSRLQILPVEPLKDLQRKAWRYLISRHGANNVGDYLEFGVFAGASMGCMADVVRELRLFHVRLFGFDSFEGMPAREDEGTGQPGSIKIDVEMTKAILRKSGADMRRITLTKGRFPQTLTPALRQRYGMRKASVVTVDCASYASCAAVLRFVEPLILDEAIVIFDDWRAHGLSSRDVGAKRACAEFLDAHRELSMMPLAFDSSARHARSFIVTRAPTA